ncbi:WD40/YVTN/BNR-like repeat-containing protein [Reichenbachiella ulvae]|uniref:Photosystem II stability/assembly factor-like protein n=1 Tax=Reichenbachiella ulvae TaxID=2980104 RepID=A0ABT3CWG9_9BACT|nr:YCF48-related protein [Reichenbachiella ulvae]MCV9388038.1 photosystem II stability/assembly factor-like protein [Reichenbachiella ulvae]
MKTPLLLLLCLPIWLQAQTVVDSTASLRGISVLDENVIWVSGSNSTIAKTEDGGTTWVKISIPETDGLDFRDVEVFSATEVLVMSAGEGELSNIFKTEDGGTTWEKVYANSEPKGFFNGFSFDKDGRGVLTGDPVDGKLFVLKTKNKGASWKRVRADKLPLMAQDEAGGFAASGSHLYLGEEFFINGTGGRMSRIIKSNRSLSVWKPIYVPMIQGESSQGIFSIDFCDKNNGIAVGGDYTQPDIGEDNVMITSDGGEVWVPADNFPVYQSSVKYLNCDRVISTGPSATYLSNDGGFTWERVDAPGFHTLGVGPDGNIWAAGSGGRVMNIKL